MSLLLTDDIENKYLAEEKVDFFVNFRVFTITLYLCFSNDLQNCILLLHCSVQKLNGSRDFFFLAKITRVS